MVDAREEGVQGKGGGSQGGRRQQLEHLKDHDMQRTEQFTVSERRLPTSTTSTVDGSQQQDR